MYIVPLCIIYWWPKPYRQLTYLVQIQLEFIGIITILKQLEFNIWGKVIHLVLQWLLSYFVGVASFFDNKQGSSKEQSIHIEGAKKKML